MADMLALTQGLPETAYAPGDTVVHEGGAAGGIWVLLSGDLDVRKGTTLVNTITRAGALIGEISVLLSTAHSATVIATAPSVLRYAADGAALLRSDPAITLMLAMGLAERLHVVTTYLADLKQQYGDAPGLSMVSEVMREIAHTQGRPARAGSMRDPDTG